MVEEVESINILEGLIGELVETDPKKLEEKVSKYTFKKDTLEKSKIYRDYFVIPSISKDKNYSTVLALNAVNHGLKWSPEEELIATIEYAKQVSADAIIFNSSWFSVYLNNFGKNFVRLAENQKYFVKDKDIPLPDNLRRKGIGRNYITIDTVMKGLGRSFKNLLKGLKDYEGKALFNFSQKEKDIINKFVSEYVKSTSNKSRSLVRSMISQMEKNTKKYEDELTELELQKNDGINTVELVDVFIPNVKTISGYFRPKGKYQREVECEKIEDGDIYDAKDKGNIKIVPIDEAINFYKELILQRNIEIAENKEYNKIQIMRNTNKVQIIKDCMEKEFIYSIEQIPNVIVMGDVSNLEINGRPIQSRSDVIQGTISSKKNTSKHDLLYMLRQINKRKREVKKKKTKDGLKHAVPYLILGNFNGNYFQESIMDTSDHEPGRNSQLIISGFPQTYEKYAYVTQLPVFVKDEVLEEILENKVILSNEPTQKMFKKHADFGSYAVSITVGEDIIYNTLIPLSQLREIYENIKSENLSKFIKKPVYLKASKSDTHNGSGFTKIRIASTKEWKELVSLYGADKFPSRIINANEVFSIFFSVFGNICNISIQGDLCQGDHYGIKDEKNGLTRTQTNYKRFLVEKTKNETENLEDFYSDDYNANDPCKYLRELNESDDPLSSDDRAYLNWMTINKTNLAEQKNLFIESEIVPNKDEYYEMFDYTDEINYYGPNLVFINGNHDDKANEKVKGNKTGEIVSLDLTIKATKELERGGRKVKGRIQSGHMGSGLGLAEYTIGIEGEEECNIKEMHDPKATTMEKLIEKSYLEGSDFHLFYAGHYHNWKSAASKEKIFIQNGTTQAKTEFSEMLRFGPSCSIATLQGICVKGPFKGEMINIPISFDFAFKALIKPEKMKNLKKTLNIYGVDNDSD